MSYGSISGGAAVPNNCRIGMVDYNDLATATTAISLTGVTPVYLTNDAAGPFTNEAYLPDGVTSIWDEVAGEFDFTQLKLGDMIDLRVAIQVTTTAPNQEIYLDLELGIGGSAYTIPFIDVVEKAAEPHEISIFNGVYMGDTNTLNNPAKFKVSSAEDLTVVVYGWYCKILIAG